MQYINVGVSDSGGKRIKTKKALKEMVKADPRSVIVDSTALFGTRYDGYLSEMPEGVTLSVVGPDPYNDRKWYASVKRNGDNITVS